LLSIGFFAKAHSESGYEAGKAKSNSLLYIYNAETDQASWATYDTNLDSWTKGYLGENPKNATNLNEIPLFSKYKRPNRRQSTVFENKNFPKSKC
jgi:hypothetical protein